MTIECNGCHRTFELPIEDSRFYEWLNGADLVEVMPHLNKTERALLLTGYCDVCYTTQFPVAQENRRDSD